MTHEDFNKLQLDLFDDILKMAKTKGVEYASDKNERLANFKRLAVELEIPAPKIGYIYFKKHLDSINTYLKDGRVYSEEGIKGRFVDAINYLTLIYGLIVDEAENAKVKDEKQDSTTSILPGLSTSGPLRFIYKGGSPIYCKSCKQAILIGEEYNSDVSGYNHYQTCPATPPLHKLSDILCEGIYPHTDIPSVCSYCVKNIYFGEGYIKFYSGHYAHDKCYKHHENEKTQEARTPEENKSLDTGNTRKT